jgi:methylisocitrate lyase
MSPSDRVGAFHRLHESGCFVTPNPWDRGSARLLAQLGFPALATTSSGFAWSMGRPDNGVTLDQALAHFQTVAEAVTIPVSADFEHGFADQPAQVAEHVSAAVRTGIAGLSIEDSTGDDANPLYAFDLAVERIGAARAAIDASGTGVLLTGRSDCLFAPGIKSVADITAIVRAVAPKPVNVLVASDWTTVPKLAELGVRRISTGGALARAAWAGFLTAATEIATQGTFAALARAVPLSGDMNRAFS